MKFPKIKFGRLEIIVFIAGTVVMILELIASRILAPYLGTSIFVWSSIIGVVLGALTIGYYLGGQLSKTNPTVKFLTNILLFAGISILFVGFFKDYILYYLIFTGVKLGSVISTILLFAVPSLLLGIVSPYAARLKIDDIKTAGGVVGNLYALSTIGSIFGTFLAGFYLIPTFGSSQIIFGLSFVLILTSILGKGKVIKISFLVLTVVLFFVNQALASTSIYEGDSEYNHIMVIDMTLENRPVRVLFMGTEAHSIIFRDSDDVFSGYMNVYRLDKLFKPEINNTLTLGGGAYVAPLDFLKRYPQSKMTVIEIDPKVTEVAKKYFKLKDHENLKIIHEDGRIFINQNKEKFDVIYGDSYASYYSLPFQLTTKEAFDHIYSALNDNGVFMLNTITAIKGEKSLFFQAVYKTLSETFNQIIVCPANFENRVTDYNQEQNVVLIALKNKDKINDEQILESANEKEKEILKNCLWPEISINPKTKILTDDFAPVDYYISKLIN